MTGSGFVLDGDSPLNQRGRGSDSGFVLIWVDTDMLTIKQTEGSDKMEGDLRMCQVTSVSASSNCQQRQCESVFVEISKNDKLYLVGYGEVMC